MAVNIPLTFKNPVITTSYSSRTDVYNGVTLATFPSKLLKFEPKRFEQEMYMQYNQNLTNRASANQGIPRMSWNAMVYYCIQKNSTSSYLETDQSNSAPIPLFKIHFNIIISSTSVLQVVFSHLVSPSIFFTQLPSIRATWPAHLFLLDFVVLIIFAGMYRSWSTWNII
jgi:hypothetical protein